MSIGWIKIHRKIIDDPVFQNEKLLKVWLYCLLKASHKEHESLVGMQPVKVNPGEFVFGRKKAAAELNMKESTVWDRMKLLEKIGNIDIKSNNKFSVVNVVNWAKYQDKETEAQQQNQQQTDNSPTTNQQQTDTNKNVKKGKNGKNEKNKDNSRHSAKRTYDEDSIHYQLASDFFERIKINNPEAKQPNLQKWADDIRKMIELDNRTPEQIKNMIGWSQAHEFWSGVVLSAGNLRKQYDKMKVQALNSSKPTKKQPYNNQSTRKETLPDWAKEGNTSKTEKPMSEEDQAALKERLKRIQSFGKD